MIPSKFSSYTNFCVEIYIKNPTTVQEMRRPAKKKIYRNQVNYSERNKGRKAEREERNEGNKKEEVMCKIKEEGRDNGPGNKK